MKQPEPESRYSTAQPGDEIAPSRYRKLPVEIEAIRWCGTNLREVIDFTGLHPSANKWTWEEYCAVVAKDGFKIFTLEGAHMVTVGDYVIRGVAGEFYACKPDIFWKTYQRADTVSRKEPVAWRYRFHPIGVNIEGVDGPWRYVDTKEECNQLPVYQLEPLFAAPLSAQGTLPIKPDKIEAESFFDITLTFHSSRERNEVYAWLERQCERELTMCDSGEADKKPRLFYYEEAENCWMPAALAIEENFAEEELSMLDNEEVKDIRIKRIDMTDAEYESMPEAP